MSSALRRSCASLPRRMATDDFTLEAAFALLCPRPVADLLQEKPTDEDRDVVAAAP